MRDESSSTSPSASSSSARLGRRRLEASDAEAPVTADALAPANARRAAWGRALFLLVFGYALMVRCWGLGTEAFWVDEAESCINALTIQDHGVPVDHYLGLPIYENVLTRPWPEHPEYEFKDTSYSDKGLAIYHGWLPLYSIAGAYWAAGVEPDRDADFRGVKYSPDEMRRRTLVGRLPALFFGAVFLVAVFAAAKGLYGADAAWTALLTAAVCKPAVDFARQARYYAPTLALTTCVCLSVWMMYRRGWWRDFLLGALAFGLLFHAHMLSFTIAAAACCLLIPAMFRHERAVLKMLACGSIVALAVFPWVILTGFLGASSDIPKARTLLEFPGDYLAYPKKHFLFPSLALLALAWLFVAGSPRLRAKFKLPARLVDPFVGHRRAFFFLAAWAFIGFVAFLLLMPSASYFYRRMTLTIMGPAFLFGAMAFTAAGRAVFPRRPTLVPVAAAGMLVLSLWVFGKATFWPRPQPVTFSPTYDVIESLRGRHIAPGTKVYATPNDHLTMTFYTGMPVGDVAAVRKSYLDNHPGEVLILEAPRYDWLKPKEIAHIAEELFDLGLTDEQAEALDVATRSRPTLEDLEGQVATVRSALGPPPEGQKELYAALVDYQRQKTAEGLVKSFRNEGNPMFKGYSGPHYGYWWQTFFYRFVDPESRIGPNLNYAERVREASAEVLRLGWVIYECPPRIAREAGVP